MRCCLQNEQINSSMFKAEGEVEKEGEKIDVLRERKEKRGEVQQLAFTAPVFIPH